jgi:DNA polymerase-1
MTKLDGYNLLHQGGIALSEMESNGMRIDIPYLEKATEQTAYRIKALEENLRSCDEFKLQRRKYGVKTNITSRQQLGSVLFNEMGHEPLAHTKTGRAQLDETALEKINSKYTKGFIRLEKLNKLLSTYLLPIKRELCGEYLHAFFGLHLVSSYRGQCDSPNLQNIPIRDPVQGPIIRKAFIPDPGCAIVEIDYSSAEVRVACALSGDQKLTYDATQGDMHRDMAAECYMLSKKDVIKPVRQAGKNSFVFAEFYGDYYKQVSANLWEAIERHKLVTASGTPLYDHLLSKGITGRGECDHDEKALPGTFEFHIQQVEDRFWNKRFKVYHAKRRQWIEEYNNQGYIDIVTGFRCNGPLSKNQVMNMHIQGPAFHCLLWSLIKLTKEIKRRKMKTKLICQIHDSIIANVPISELDDYLELANDIATKKVRQEWEWLTVPLVVEAEMSLTNWYEKKSVEIGG